ncbi:MAG: hypothetical protein V3U45_05320 [bacterium]
MRGGAGVERGRVGAVGAGAGADGAVREVGAVVERGRARVAWTRGPCSAPCECSMPE